VIKIEVIHKDHSNVVKTTLSNVELESIISLSNNTIEGNKVKYTYNGNTYECSIVGNNDIKYQAGSFVYFCILCKSPNSQNIRNFYLSELEYLNITPAISSVDNNFINSV
jgi:hypothetical protein